MREVFSAEHLMLARQLLINRDFTNDPSLPKALLATITALPPSA
jgi:hypothetical protein